jgi:hypothetical protein
MRAVLGVIPHYDGLLLVKPAGLLAMGQNSASVHLEHAASVVQLESRPLK